MNKLSVVLATHNEEKNLAACLDAVKSLADEIIIADGESTDDTVKIAQRFGAKIIRTSNKANFHINKQMAMDKARYELVLQLDADEVVDTELKKFISNLKKQLVIPAEPARRRGGAEIQKSRQPVAWWLKRKNLFLGRFLTKGGQYPDPVIRLYINGFARLPQKDVHEQMEVEGKVAWAEGHLLHYSNPEFSDYLRKFNAYTSLKASQLKDEKVETGVASFIEYFLIKPLRTFLSLYLRHKGFYDGLPGLVFALMSAIYWPISYLKFWELYQKNKIDKA